MKIKMLISMAGGLENLKPGDEIERPVNVCEAWAARGYAEIIKEPAKKAKKAK